MDGAKFIKAWQKSVTIAEAAKKLGKPEKAVKNLATYFRSHGVPLKKFRRGAQNWDKLKELAKKLSK